jgi:hypothetical protein
MIALAPQVHSQNLKLISRRLRILGPPDRAVMHRARRRVGLLGCMPLTSNRCRQAAKDPVVCSSYGDNAAAPGLAAVDHQMGLSDFSCHCWHAEVSCR